MTVSLRSLRFEVDMNASKFLATANQFEAANDRMASSARDVGNAVSQQNDKIGRASSGIERLSRTYISGYGEAARYNAELLKLGRAMETTSVGSRQLEGIVSGMSKRFGMTADSASIAAAGYSELARAVDNLNSRMSNMSPMDMKVASMSTEELQQRVGRLRAEIDPLAAATDRLNSELAEYAALAKSGALSQHDLSRAQALAHTRFQETEKSLKGVADGTANASYQAKNLRFQLMDVGQSLAGGMPAWMVLMQQGPQIAQIYGPEEGGIGRAFKETAKQAGALAASFWPIGLAAAAGAAAIAGMQHEINAMSGVDVTFMDVATASIEVFTDAIYDQLKPSIDAISPMFATAWDGVIYGVKTAGNYVINTWLTAYEMVKFAWDQFPNAIGAAMIGAANAALSATGSLINGTASLIDGYIDQINSALSMVPGGLELGRIGQFDMAKVKLANPYADALKTAAGEQRKTLEQIAKSDPLGDYFDAVKIKSIENANDRIKETEKATKGAASAADEAARAFEQFSSRANGLVDKYFPGESARREAMELQGLLSQYGSQLDTFQRQSVEMRIADQFKAAGLGLRELTQDTREAGTEMASALADTLGSTLSGLFSKPIKDLDQFVDEVMGDFAPLGAEHIATIISQIEER